MCGRRWGGGLRGEGGRVVLGSGWMEMGRLVELVVASKSIWLWWTVVACTVCFKDFDLICESGFSA